jgi:hypothetical protein
MFTFWIFKTAVIKVIELTWGYETLSPNRNADIYFCIVV